MILYPVMIPQRKPEGTGRQRTIISVLPRDVAVTSVGGRSGAERKI